MPAPTHVAADVLADLKARQAPWRADLSAQVLIGCCIPDDIAASLIDNNVDIVSVETLTDGLYRLAWQGDAQDIIVPESFDLVTLAPGSPSLSEPGLLLMDMDSTAITIECIDEIARKGGVYEQVAAVTAEAMAGGLPFTESLKRRAAMLKGIPASVLDDLAAEPPLMPGLLCLCHRLKANGWKLALASGGFVPVAKAVAGLAELDYFEANTLSVAEDLLTGEVEGGIVDAERKAQILAELGEQWQIPQHNWVAMGDGANDLKMLGASNLGVGVHAKPKVAAQADVAINNPSLAAVLGVLRP